MKALSLRRRRSKEDEVPHLIEASTNTLQTSFEENIVVPKEKTKKPNAFVNRRGSQQLSLSQTQTVFWTSRTAIPIYVFFGLFVWTKAAIFLHAISCILAKLLFDLIQPWLVYASEDPEARSVARYLRRVVRILRREGKLLLSGNYGRQVVTAYVIHACTAPGESYISFIIRHKMNLLNQQWMEDLQSWSESRLGYEKSRRNIFA